MKKFLTLSLSALILSGCATGATLAKSASKRTHTEQDQIRYIAQTDEKTPSLLLLGDRYTYRILDGTSGHNLNALSTIANTLDHRHLKPSTAQIHLSPSKSDIKTANNRVSFIFEYDKKGEPYTQSELAILNKYCHKATYGTYIGCELEFDTTIHPKLAPTPKMTALKGKYFVNINTHQDPSGVWKAIAPLAFVFDIVTLPVQALGIGVLMGK